MAGPSNIEWTDATWNPVTGCTRVSSGCDHCYAVAMTHRIANMNHSPARAKYAYLTVLNEKGDRHFNGTVRCHEDVLDTPLKWKKPRRIFVNSMSDLFHKDVPFEFIDGVFAVMAVCPQHTFQVLTKRPERMAEYLSADRGPYKFEFDHTTSEDHIQRFVYTGFAVTGDRFWKLRSDLMANAWAGWRWPLPNVWLGTSAEDQKTADERIPHLLKCPAAVRFLSVEPMLGPVDILRAITIGNHNTCIPGMRFGTIASTSLGIHWVIVGGESGPGARPMHPDWVRSVRDQCAAAGVPVFFKQWGEWEPVTPLYDGRDDRAENGRGDLQMVDRAGRIYTPEDGQPNDLRTWLMERVGKSAAGAELDGVEHREWPKAVTS